MTKKELQDRLAQYPDDSIVRVYYDEKSVILEITDVYFVHAWTFDHSIIIQVEKEA